MFKTLSNSNDRKRRKGFSFAEVMFAVIVLGIGFIMIAAIFPVAIQQSKATNDETTAAATAKTVISSLQDVLSNGTPTSASDLPALTPITGFSVGAHVFGQVYSLRDPQPGTATTFPPLNGQPISPAPAWVADQLWNKAKGNLISSTDPRFACVVLYRRDGTVQPNPSGPGNILDPSPYVQIYVISTQVRNRSLYDPATLAVDVATKTTPVPATPPVNLQARPVKVAITPKDANAAGVDLVAFDTTVPNSAGADEGCYVVIARDNITTPTNDIGRMNGRIYRVGTRRTDLDSGNSIVFELQPGGDFTPDPGNDGVLGGSNSTDDITAIGNTTAVTTPASPNSTTKASGAADAFIVGRNLQPGSTLAAPIFEGPAQDISIYTTFIQPK
jgi:type II secretory pathway pseudopilin PulG